MRSRVAADRAVYDSASGVWQLFDYTVRLIPAENIAERTEEEGVKPLDPLGKYIDELVNPYELASVSH